MYLLRSLTTTAEKFGSFLFRHRAISQWQLFIRKITICISLSADDSATSVVPQKCAGIGSVPQAEISCILGMCALSGKRCSNSSMCSRWCRAWRVEDVTPVYEEIHIVDKICRATSNASKEDPTRRPEAAKW